MSTLKKKKAKTKKETNAKRAAKKKEA